MSAAVVLESILYAKSAKALAGRPQPSAASEVLGVSARHLFELPRPPRLGLHVPGVEGVVRVSVGDAGAGDAGAGDAGAGDAGAGDAGAGDAGAGDAGAGDAGAGEGHEVDEGEIEGHGADGREVCFDGNEWAALVVGTEADRVWPSDLTLFCRRKLADPAYRLGRFDALAGAQPDGSEEWDLRAVLDRLGAELLSVETV